MTQLKTFLIDGSLDRHVHINWSFAHFMERITFKKERILLIYEEFQYMSSSRKRSPQECCGTWTQINLTFFRFASVSYAVALQACSLGSLRGLSTRGRTSRIGPLGPHWTHFCKVIISLKALGSLVTCLLLYTYRLEDSSDQREKNSHPLHCKSLYYRSLCHHILQIDIDYGCYSSPHPPYIFGMECNNL